MTCCLTEKRLRQNNRCVNVLVDGNIEHGTLANVFNQEYLIEVDADNPLHGGVVATVGHVVVLPGRVELVCQTLPAARPEDLGEQLLRVRAVRVLADPGALGGRAPCSGPDFTAAVVFFPLEEEDRVIGQKGSGDEEYAEYGLLTDSGSERTS